MRAYVDFAAVYDALMGDVDREGWVEYIERLLGAQQRSIVDCACGTGEISCGLARRGHRVTGIDVSEQMLNIAAEKARQMGLSIPFVRQDMAELKLHRAVDAVISACDGVNYLTSVTTMRRFFQAAHLALKPGGLLLFDISSRHKLQSILGGHTFTLDEEDTAYIWRNTYDASTKLLAMELTFFVREGERFRRFREEHIQRAHSAPEVEHALVEAGFLEIRAYAAFTRDAPESTTERLQYVAVKGY